MNVSREQEIKNVISHIEEAVWNGRHNDSKGYVIDLSNTNNKIEIWAEIIEPSHELFSTEAYFKIGDKPGNKEDVIKQYNDMDKPYIFNIIEFKNLSKLPEATQKMFMNNLLELETKLDNIKNNGIGANSVRVQLLKKQTEKDKLYEEKQKVEKEYIEIAEKKEENIKTINKYIDKLKRNNEFFRPINILNRLLSRTETEEQNQFYKSEAVKLEKENIKNTELIFEKMFYKNDLNKKIQELEKEVSELRRQYELEDKDQLKESDILKEKNMLFKMFGIDRINEPIQEKELEEIEEPNEE